PAKTPANAGTAARGSHAAARGAVPVTLSRRVFAWTFQHVGLKVLSLGLAVLLWMVVAGEATVERGLRIPLELQQMPGGLEVIGDVPATEDVRVRGSS